MADTQIEGLGHREPFALEDAYEKHRAQIAAEMSNPRSSLVLDVVAAVRTMLGTIEGVRRFRDAFLELPTFDMDAFDDIETLGRAWLYVHTRYLCAVSPREAQPLLAREAATMRAFLAEDAANLTARGLLPSDALLAVRWQTSAAELAAALTQLTSMLRDHGTAVQDHTTTSITQLAQAERLATELFLAADEHVAAPPVVHALRAERDAAQRLFMRAYLEGRRGMAFLRWDHKDADVIMPPLWDDPSVGRCSDIETKAERAARLAAEADEADEDPADKPN